MKWRDEKGYQHTPCSPVNDLTSLFLAKVQFNASLELRLVGQSTSSNLALAAGSVLSNTFRDNLRVVLLDPIFFTVGFVRPGGMSVADAAYNNGKQIVSTDGTIEFYKCSGVLQRMFSIYARSNNKLKAISAYVRLRPDNLLQNLSDRKVGLATRLMLRHTIALDYYVRSLGYRILFTPK